MVFVTRGRLGATSLLGAAGAGRVLLKSPKKHQSADTPSEPACTRSMTYFTPARVRAACGLRLRTVQLSPRCQRPGVTGSRAGELVF